MGTGVMVSVILATLGEGASPESIMASYHVTAEDIRAAVLFAADMAEDRYLAFEKVALCQEEKG